MVSHRNASLWKTRSTASTSTPTSSGATRGPAAPRGEALGLEISLAAAKAAAPYADGFYLMTPFNRVALMEQLIAAIQKEILS